MSGISTYRVVYNATVATIAALNPSLLESIWLDTSGGFSGRALTYFSDQVNTARRKFFCIKNNSPSGTTELILDSIRNSAKATAATAQSPSPGILIISEVTGGGKTDAPDDSTALSLPR